MSSPSLNNLILGGCMLAYISIILMGINSSLFPKKFSVKFFMNIICPVSCLESISKYSTNSLSDASVDFMYKFYISIWFDV